MKTHKSLADIETGIIQKVKAPFCAPLDLLVYTPDRPQKIDKILIAVHGINREAETIITEFMETANRSNCAIIAPLFSKEAFPSYQRIADKPEQIRSDYLLNAFLEHWKAVFEKHRLNLHLFGYSGGAQFCHRYAYMNAHRVDTITLAAAGWYTFPNTNVDYPYGLKKVPAWLSKINIKDALSLNFTVYVGGKDLSRDASLRKGKEIDASQGINRIERAKKWCRAITRKRAKLGLSSEELKPIVIPGVPHNVEQLLKNDIFQHQMIKKIS